MAIRGKYINNLAVVAGLTLNLVLLGVVLQLWPGAAKHSTRPGSTPPASRHPARPKNVPRQVPAPGPMALSEPQPRVIHAAESGAKKSLPGPRVIDGPRKISRAADPGSELVAIDGETFAVPPPWLGHRIPRLIDPLHPGLVMLPLELTSESRKIYVTADTRLAFLKMAEAAARDGVRLRVDSGYRSAGYQRAIYRKRLADGVSFSEISKSVAPPGYSEHMLGCALDLVPSNWSFRGTPADRWLRENARRFSFAQTYPARDPKGFAWEPWHWKYVGDEPAGQEETVHPATHQS